MEWIDINDKLPESCERILLNCQNGIAIGEMNKYCNNGDFTSNDEYEVATHRKCVTH